ncbi:GGDEF domain-containing protein [Actinoplanes sp. NEAU-A12]|uniref:GGDEF domain-containing protein n=1 Tax=Actinoplanes sandaracinus TaxID=3045177 RepID=A0ABT6WQ55_9ACTN|nr:GGDEF domain-containing protein [Actinoplanes sandaracinus]MDI6101839.1 GGDEF domain-containing protein [Actinoplanes sandaracinus]
MHTIVSRPGKLPSGRDESLSRPATSRAPHRVTVGLAVLSAAFAFGYMSGGTQVRMGLMLLSGIIAAVAIAVGLRVHHVRDQRPWLLVIVALLLLTITNAAWLIYALLPGGRVPPNSVVVAPMLGGYVFLLAASLMVVLRHAPRDASGTIDAAVWGIALAAPVWEFLFRPRMLDAGVGTSTEFVVLTQLLVLLGICGALLRLSRTSGAGRICLRFLFSSLGWTILGTAVVNMGGAGAKEQASFPALFFALGYLALGAAGLHPSVKQLSEPVDRLTVPTPQLRLARLGAALLLIPLCGGLAQLLGDPADGLLLTIAPVLSIPLVLVRIGRLKHALVHQATHDELTGLVNRRHLFTEMQKAIAAHAGGAPGDLALIYCDLNGFKPVNDEYGHEAGDAILRGTARRITEAVRTGDVVARIGGDEFLIFCTDADDVTVRALSDRISRSIATPVVWGEHTLGVTAAIGAVHWTERRRVAPDELLAAADARMYADKRARSRPVSAERGQNLRAERLDERQQVLAHVMQVDPVEAESGIAS